MSRSRTGSLAIVGAFVVGAGCGGSSDSPGDDAASAVTTAATDSPPSSDAESGTDPDSAADEVSNASTSVSSSDGVVTIVDAPADLGVSIEPTDAFVGVEAPFTGLAYELGPEGSVFDPPLHVEVDVADLGPVAVFHRQGDVISPVEFEIEDGLARFELDSFSALEFTHFGTGTSAGTGSESIENQARFSGVVGASVGLDAPQKLLVDVRTPVGWDVVIRTGGGDAMVYSDEYSLLLDPDDYSAVGPVQIDPPAGDGEDDEGGEFWCTGVGQGGLRFSGPGEVVTSPFGEDTSFRSERIESRVDFECVERPKVIPPEDERCFDRQTGTDRDDCPTAAELGIGFEASDQGVTVHFPERPDDEITLGVGGGTDYRYLETILGAGTRGFFGPGFASYDPDSDEFFLQGDAQITIVGMSFDATGAGLPVLVFPGGTSPQGTEVSPTSGDLTDLSVFVEAPNGASGIYFWGPETLAAGISAP